jgi:hypothetical protein
LFQNKNGKSRDIKKEETSRPSTITDYHSKNDAKTSYPHSTRTDNSMTYYLKYSGCDQVKYKSPSNTETLHSLNRRQRKTINLTGTRFQNDIKMAVAKMAHKKRTQRQRLDITNKIEDP